MAFIRCFHEREGRDIAQPQRGHLQNNRGQIGAQDFRIGKGRTAQEIVFGIEPYADPFRHAPATSFTLIRGGLRNRLYRQALHFRAIAVAADTRRAGIDNVFDARYGQRRFGDVGCQHDTPPAVRLKYPVLLAVRQTGIERQHFGMGQIALHQRVGGIANFALTAHKNQDVAPAFPPQLIDRVKDGLQLIAVNILRLFHHRTITHFYRIGAARHLNHRRVVEMTREALGIDGC